MQLYYMAIWLLPSETLALAPQTVLEPSTLRELSDYRWIDRLQEVAILTKSPDFLDLKCLYATSSAATSSQRVTIYIGTDDHDLDYVHARRLGGDVQTIRLTEAPLAHSAIIVAMRSSGVLRSVIETAIRGAPNRVDAASLYRQWMAARAHSFEAELKADSNDNFQVIGQVKNVGFMTLSLAETVPNPIRVGMRIWFGDQFGEHTHETRGIFAARRLYPGQSCDFNIQLASEALAPGSYVGLISLVQEGMMWFDSLGFSFIKLKFSVSRIAQCSIFEIDKFKIFCNSEVTKRSGE